MLIDAHAHLGSWPFTLVAERKPAALVAELRDHGIRQAIVGHLGAVLAPEPGPANRELFRAVQASPGLTPLPTINPLLANWREELDACASSAAINAVKIVPNYHNYSLAARPLGDFIGALRQRKLRLVIQTRLEDERHRYFALRIKGVPVPQLALFLQKFPNCSPLILGLYLPEIRELAHYAANFSIDTAFAEWEETMVDLLQVLPARQILFGSHTPLHSTSAQVAKLRLARIRASARNAIGTQNAQRFFSV
jgi:predicted TIM-barrel fold metal-dependent hydrolase